MELLKSLAEALVQNWPIWLVSACLVVGAVIDGVALRVPNWLTLPLIGAGCLYSTLTFGWPGLAGSLVGIAVGLALLLPAYSIGGMGAGDVKLLAGVGAWVHATHTLQAFCVAAVIGGIMAVAMVLVRGGWRKHLEQFQFILVEILTIRDPHALAAIAAQRKPTMMLLPYGIPITVGTLLYFAWAGMLV